jgi:hypothetical protein
VGVRAALAAAVLVEEEALAEEVSVGDEMLFLLPTSCLLSYR